MAQRRPVSHTQFCRAASCSHWSALTSTNFSSICGESARSTAQRRSITVTLPTFHRPSQPSVYSPHLTLAGAGTHQPLIARSTILKDRFECQRARRRISLSRHTCPSAAGESVKKAKRMSVGENDKAA